MVNCENCATILEEDGEKFQGSLKSIYQLLVKASCRGRSRTVASGRARMRIAHGKRCWFRSAVHFYFLNFFMYIFFCCFIAHLLRKKVNLERMQGPNITQTQAQKVEKVTYSIHVYHIVCFNHYFQWAQFNCGIFKCRNYMIHIFRQELQKKVLCK